MSCEFCKDPELVNGLNYCPYCGNDLKMNRFITGMFKAAKETTRKLYLQSRIDVERINETVEIDGQTFVCEYVKSSPKKPRPTPLDYSFDPDKIDISKEMEMLVKHYNPFAEHSEYISERLEQMIKEKENEEII